MGVGAWMVASVLLGPSEGMTLNPVRCPCSLISLVRNPFFGGSISCISSSRSVLFPHLGSPVMSML